MVARLAYVFQPTTPTRDPGRALGGEDLRERQRAVTGLGREAEVLEQVPPHRQWRRARHAVTLVADEDRRVASGADDEQRLLEPRVEAGEYAMLALCSRSAYTRMRS